MHEMLCDPLFAHLPFIVFVEPDFTDAFVVFA